MPQCALVLVASRREGQDRGVATAVQREPSSHIPGVVDAPGICFGRRQNGCRMNPGNSPSGRTKNRGTVKNPGNSPSGRTKNRGTVTSHGSAALTILPAGLL